MTDLRALLVLTSHDDLGGARATGYFVGEAAHPWKVFTDAGYRVDVASVAGGVPPEDGRDADDPVQEEFLADADVSAALADSQALADVDAAGYDVVYLVGGHGTMWDFPGNEHLAGIARSIHERGGAVAAVCHGPAGLVDLTLSDGSLLVDGRTVTGFTNEEEESAGHTADVPFLLEDRLREVGATFVAQEAFGEHVEVDGMLVTGQNPQSAGKVAEEVVRLLGDRNDLR